MEENSLPPFPSPPPSPLLFIESRPAVVIYIYYPMLVSCHDITKHQVQLYQLLALMGFFFPLDKFARFCLNLLHIIFNVYAVEEIEIPVMVYLIALPLIWINTLVPM